MVIFRLDKGHFKFEEQFQEFHEWNEFLGNFPKNLKLELESDRFPRIVFESLFISCRFVFKIGRKLSVTKCSSVGGNLCCHMK